MINYMKGMKNNVLVFSVKVISKNFLNIILDEIRDYSFEVVAIIKVDNKVLDLDLDYIIMIENTNFFKVVVIEVKNKNFNVNNNIKMVFMVFLKKVDYKKVVSIKNINIVDICKDIIQIRVVILDVVNKKVNKVKDFI